MTATAWMAQLPTRTEAQRKADRDELLNELKAAREVVECEHQRRVRARGDDVDHLEVVDGA